jgi:hypothetical protein
MIDFEDKQSAQSLTLMEKIGVGFVALMTICGYVATLMGVIQ